MSFTDELGLKKSLPEGVGRCIALGNDPLSCQPPSPPEPAPPEPEGGPFTCEAKCNFKYQLVCTGIGSVSGIVLDPAIGAAAAGSCMYIKFKVCKNYCTPPKPDSCSVK